MYSVLKVCLRKLDAHFCIEANVPYKRHVFCQLVPTQRKTLDKFMICLHVGKQAHQCNYGEHLNKNLQDQLIEKFPDVALKKKLLEVNN